MNRPQAERPLRTVLSICTGINGVGIGFIKLDDFYNSVRKLRGQTGSWRSIFWGLHVFC
jgi:uncharacterized membrane protein YuzA (DUF378 family)